MAFEFIARALEKRKNEGLLRSLSTIDSTSGVIIEVAGKHYINFSSNDYLAMRGSHVVAQAWVDGIGEYGGGSGASPLVTGYTNAHQALEAYLATELKRDKVMLFGSGFAANQAVCQALFCQSPSQADNVIIADKLMHASFIDGARVSEAKLARYKHNDLHHLANLLQAETQRELNILVATESIFSMDGDKAPITSMLPLVDSANAWLMVDDAHGFGVLGEQGMGVAQALNLSQQQVPILMGTFGKAIGTAGAFVAGSQALIDYLLNFARHYIYSTAMPAAQAYATLISLQSKKINQNRLTLTKRIAQFKSLTHQAGIKVMDSDTAIQPILIGNTQQTLEASEKLKQLGVWVSAIRYPTVPKHSDRLRITLTAGHEEQDIQALVDALHLVLGPINRPLVRAK